MSFVVSKARIYLFVVQSDLVLDWESKLNTSSAVHFLGNLHNLLLDGGVQVVQVVEVGFCGLRGGNESIGQFSCTSASFAPMSSNDRAVGPIGQCSVFHQFQFSWGVGAAGR